VHALCRPGGRLFMRRHGMALLVGIGDWELGIGGWIGRLVLGIAEVTRDDGDWGEAASAEAESLGLVRRGKMGLGRAVERTRNRN
jgi:hypothetical protein